MVNDCAFARAEKNSAPKTSAAIDMYFANFRFMAISLPFEFAGPAADRCAAQRLETLVGYG